MNQISKLSAILSATVMLGAALLNAQTKVATATAKPRPKEDKPPSAPVPVLSESAGAAVTLSQAWGQDGLNGKVPLGFDGKGRVVFPFGDSMPTLVCAPLRECAIELEPGEHVTGDVNLGDTVRWNLVLAYYGNPNDGSQVPTFVLKPKFASLDTNMIITTDRRAYYFRLVSHATDYIARFSFTYPEDEKRRMAATIAEHQAAPPLPIMMPTPLPTPEQKQEAQSKLVAGMRFSFTVAGGKAPCVRPVAVYENTDQGTTMVKMPDCVHARPLPTLLVLEGGKEVETNQRFLPAEDTFIVDRLFDHAVLRMGGDHKAIKREVRIDRLQETASNGK